MIIYNFRLLCVRLYVIFSITKSIDIDDDVLIQGLNEHATFVIHIINTFQNLLTSF